MKNPFKLPTPKDLGMTNNIGMSMEKWKEYNVIVRRDYPIRFFFSETLSDFFVYKMFKPIKNVWYYIVSHIVPSRRYHMLDLRQPKGSPTEYRYGWIDSDWQMTFAMFNILVRYVEIEMPHGFFVPTAEDFKNPDITQDEVQSMLRHIEKYNEIMALYNYWKIERPILEAKHDEALTAWHTAKEKNGGSISSVNDTPEIKRLWNELNVISDARDKKLEEMLHRLVDIRSCLWT